MSDKVWTHPDHPIPAVVATVLSFLTLSFMILAIGSCMFSDDRQNESKCLTLWDSNIKCNEYCKYSKDGKQAGWQSQSYALSLVVTTIDVVACVSLVLVFWPLAVMSGIYNIILKLCAALQVISGAIKVVVSFRLMWLQIAINEHYVWFKPGAYEMLLLPPAYIQFSAIFGFLALMGLIVACDTGPPNGPTYLEDAAEKEREATKIAEMAKRVSVYRPSSKLVLDQKSKSGSSTSV